MLKSFPSAAILAGKISTYFRMRYFTQDLVVFAGEIPTQLRRNTLIPPRCNSEDSYSRNSIKTIIDQGHLAPFSSSTLPLYWDHDRFLSLTACPDLLVMSENSSPFSLEYKNCISVNPGYFSRNEFSFYTYYPSKRRIEKGKVP